MKEETTGGVLECLLAEPGVGETRAAATSGIIVGTLSGFDGAGRPLVTWASSDPSAAVAARSTVALDPDQAGQEVVVAFEGGDPSKPIVLGALSRPRTAPRAVDVSSLPLGLEADVDGEALVLTAKREIILRCGKASITLTRAGKILIRGAYLLSRSTGVNRIQGGSVQIN
jgi:Domain of unknown function (DUF6484)